MINTSHYKLFHCCAQYTISRLRIEWHRWIYPNKRRPTATTIRIVILRNQKNDESGEHKCNDDDDVHRFSHLLCKFYPASIQKQLITRCSARLPSGINKFSTTSNHEEESLRSARSCVPHSPHPSCLLWRHP